MRNILLCQTVLRSDRVRRRTGGEQVIDARALLMIARVALDRPAPPAPAAGTLGLGRGLGLGLRSAQAHQALIARWRSAKGRSNALRNVSASPAGAKVLVLTH